MKRLSLALVGAIVTLSPLLASAQIRLPSFNQLCEYESDCKKVGKIKDKSLVYKMPKPELMSYYGDARMRAAIIRIAEQYQIDPVTLVLAPLAENTMNVNITDKVQDDMEAAGMLDDDGAFMGRAMSIGPGQIYVRAAKNVENLAALIENRQPREKKQIKQQLKTPEGALRYAAAIIRDAQEVYARGGHDISKRPEILATLYNIGKVKDRLRNGQGRTPQPNYFGYFVGLNYAYVQKTLNLPSTLDGSAKW